MRNFINGSWLLGSTRSAFNFRPDCSAAKSLRHQRHGIEAVDQSSVWRKDELTMRAIPVPTATE
jgi:hypothetical protein